VSATQSDALIGIDLGTASVKVVVTDVRGVLLVHTSADYAVRHPHSGWAESDPYDWVQSITTAVGNAMAAVDVRPVAVGLSGQMHGVVFADAGGRPVRPAMLWSDGRATAEMEVYRRMPDAVRGRLANPLVPGMAGPMMGWVAHHEPASLAAARWALQPKDWVRQQLTGDIHAEPSDASATLLYDFVADDWDRDVLDALGLDPRIVPDLLPSSSAPAGTVTPDAAELFGLPAGIPVAAGAADTAAALLGGGPVQRGVTYVTIGTGIQIVTAMDELPAVLSPHPVTHVYRTANPSGWYAMAAVLNGGSTLSWVRQILGMTWRELYATASLPLRDDDPLFVPHLHGERTPWLDATLRGAWTDLNPRHDRATLGRAALEGVAIAIKTAFEALAPAAEGTLPVRLAGGGTLDPGWRKMLADAINRPLDAVDVSAVSGLGAALLAGMSSKTLAFESSQTRPGERVATPDADGVERFSQRAATLVQRTQILREASAAGSTA
jgi:xylulokinase